MDLRKRYLADEMNLPYNIALYVAISVGITSVAVIIEKRRMCIDYQVRNSRFAANILRVFYGISEAECLLQCARHPDCVAYNMWHGNRTCELVPGLGHCVETEEEEGSKFVGLGECDGEVPWDVGRRKWTSDGPCLAWQRHFATDNEGSCPVGTQRGPGGWPCVSLLPNNGLYLPGWCANKRGYRVITEQQQGRICPGWGYVLLVSPGCPTTWQSYTVGDPIPSRAVKVSTWTDGTPLYVVAGFPPNYYLGYISSDAQRTLIFKEGLQSPTNVRILVFT